MKEYVISQIYIKLIVKQEKVKEKLRRVVDEDEMLQLLFMIIDSYEVTPGKGLPLGNQTSQWFALFYLDGMDRIIKEKMHIKYYSRYMDDFVLQKVGHNNPPNTH